MGVAQRKELMEGAALRDLRAARLLGGEADMTKLIKVVIWLVLSVISPRRAKIYAEKGWDEAWRK